MRGCIADSCWPFFGEQHSRRRPLRAIDAVRTSFQNQTRSRAQTASGTDGMNHSVHWPRVEERCSQREGGIDFRSIFETNLSFENRICDGKEEEGGGGDSFQIIYLELVEEEATVVSTLIIERRGGHRYPLFKSNRGGWLLPYDVVACFPDHRGFTFLSDKIEIVGRGEYCCNPLHEKLGANWAQRTVTREANWRKQSVRGVRPFPLFPITDYLRGSNRIVSTWPVYTWLARHYLQLLGITMERMILLVQYSYTWMLKIHSIEFKPVNFAILSFVVEVVARPFQF